MLLEPTLEEEEEEEEEEGLAAVSYLVVFTKFIFKL